MAKKELQWSPLLGQFMTLAGAVFVDRGNNARAVRSLTAAGEIMKQRKSSLWLFPEGTRSMRPYPDMLPFKKGAFHTAVQAQVPIVPVICENYWRLYRKGVFEGGTLKVKGAPQQRGRLVRVTHVVRAVLPPVPTEGLTAADVSDLAIRVHDMMVESLREISAPPPPGAEPKTTLPAVTPTLLETPVQSSVPAEQPKSNEPEQPRTESRTSSSVSENSATSSPVLTYSRMEGSEYGTETEEDDAMVLVGRPSN